MHSPNPKAFSLVELLVVMGIIVSLLALVVPALVSVNSAGDLTKSTYLVAGAVDSARSDAMARGTYRYIALETDVVGGNAVLRVKTLGFKPSGRFPGDSSSSLVLLAPVLTVGNLQLAAFPDDNRQRTVSDQKLADLPASYRLTRNGSFNNAFLLELAANGQAQLIEAKPDPNNPAASPSYSRSLKHWIELGLLPTRGATALPGADTGNRATIQIAGLTGQTQVWRPQ